MKDLEIRGAGNILGAEQIGHIAGVGFDLYIRLVGRGRRRVPQQAGAGEGDEEERCRGAGGPAGRRARPARLRHGERLRLEVYRKIAEAADQARSTRSSRS
jgi:transcription-repair coupling factor (superfamily II helicase)